MVPSQTEQNRQVEPRLGRSVSLDYAAELLGVSRRTIYNRIRENRLQTIRTVGGSQRVLVDSLGSQRRRGLSRDPSPARNSSQALEQEQEGA